MTTTAADYRVELDAYSGPLDLLLYLVKRDEIDLHDIPIGELAEQYLAHLRLLQHIDVNLAGEFLVMAATLLEIKSAMLVPKVEASEGEAAAVSVEQLDPRYELVQQLLAYKRFKDAANALDDRRHDWAQRFAHLPARAASTFDLSRLNDPDYDPDADPNAPATEIDLEDVSLHDLAEAFLKILETLGQGPAQVQVVYDDTPISLHETDILDRLARDAAEGVMTLRQIFEGRSRGEAIGLFLAMLELVRLRKVVVVQDAQTHEITLKLNPEVGADSVATGAGGPKAEASPDWRDPATGEMQYEWPSEEARLRAERRSKLRATRAARAAKGDYSKDAGDEEIIDVDSDPPPEAAAPQPEVGPVEGEEGRVSSDE